MRLDSAQIDRAVGVLLGGACGDALGAGYEFGSAPLPPTGEAPAMIGGGLGGFAPGEWTDDTSMAVAIAEVAATGADLRTVEALDAIARGFRRWYDDGPADIGIQTSRVLGAAGPDPSAAAMRAEADALHAETGRTGGNGSAMRTGPVALAHPVRGASRSASSSRSPQKPAASPSRGSLARTSSSPLSTACRIARHHSTHASAARGSGCVSELTFRAASAKASASSSCTGWRLRVVMSATCCGFQPASSRTSTCSSASSRTSVEPTEEWEWGQEGYWDGFWDEDMVFYGHVLGCKGLERPAVVLGVNEGRDHERVREKLYVGMSRATDQLVVVGEPERVRVIGGDAVARRLGI